MTAYAVIIRERTINADALARHREQAPLAREKHPVTPIATYGLREVLESDDVEGVAILSFPTTATGRATAGSAGDLIYGRRACMPRLRRCAPIMRGDG